jgi:hypothetical protein
VAWLDLWPTVSLMSWIGTPLLLMIETAPFDPSCTARTCRPAQRSVRPAVTADSRALRSWRTWRPSAARKLSGCPSNRAGSVPACSRREFGLPFSGHDALHCSDGAAFTWSPRAVKLPRGRRVRPASGALVDGQQERSRRRAPLTATMIQAMVPRWESLTLEWKRSR